MASSDSPTWATTTLRVPDLGTIEGLCFDGKTTQYLGIPYATIPGRFRRPQAFPSPWPGSRWDGTKLGSYCPQPPRDYYPIPVPQRPWVQDPSVSEKDCLNLNISVPFPPSSPESAPQPLPVLVFLHGGAFTYGTGSSPLYDGRILADISRDDEHTPTIIVTLNYRLGVFGFLASEEIRSYNKAHGEAGVGNYGLWDQVEALRWISKHIRAFGGDPSRVTLSGQSAGSVSVNLHLLRDEPLFSRAVLQSGLVPLCGIMTVEQYQVLYDKTLSVLGIPSSLSPEERLNRLLVADEAAVAASMVDVFMTPVITLAPCDDHTLIPGPMPDYSAFDNFTIPPWCEEVMIGDARHECIIWNKAYRHLTAPALIARCVDVVGARAAGAILALYGITAELSPQETFYAIEKLCTDGMYLAVNYNAMRAHADCYAYHFDEPSPYDTDWVGLAHHSLENIFIWSTLRATLPPVQQAQSRRMAGLWLRFVGGGEPWARFGPREQLMFFGPDGKSEVRTAEEDAARGYARWEAIRREGLMGDFGRLSDELCILRRSLLDPNVKPRAIEVQPLQEGIKGRELSRVGFI